MLINSGIIRTETHPGFLAYPQAMSLGVDGSPSAGQAFRIATFPFEIVHLVKFYDHSQSGLSRFSSSEADENGLPQSNRITLELGIQADGIAQPIAHSVALLGPGDITALVPGQVQRREPVDGTTGFEHNAFAFVEFSDAGLPWRYTPSGPSSSGRLAPWLVLAVVPDEPPNLIRSGSNGLRILDVGQNAGALLPRPEDAWLWAHIQESDGGDYARLLCASKLKPQTKYIAAVVPLFEAGRLAGLGQPTQDVPPGQTAWTTESGSVTLPIYDYWRFKTGQDGFEALADKLFAAPPRDDFGRKPVDVTSPAPGFDAAQLSEKYANRRAWRQFSGAMVAAESSPKGWETSHKSKFKEALSDILADAGADATPARGTSYDPLVHDAVIAPPAYGALHNAAAPLKAPWAKETNLDPAFRAVAGLAARAFRAKQEDYVALAWRALAEAKSASRDARKSRTAAHVNASAHGRIQKLPKALRLQITRPMHSKIRHSGIRKSLRGLIHDLPDLPEGSVANAMARFIVARGRRNLKPGQVEQVEKKKPQAGVPEGLLDAALKDTLPRQKFLGQTTKSHRSVDYSVEIETQTGTVGRIDFEPDGSTRISPNSGGRKKNLKRTAQGGSSQVLNLRKGPITARSAAPTIASGPRNLQADFEVTVNELPVLLEPVGRLANQFQNRSDLSVLRPLPSAPIPRSVKQAIRFDMAAVNDIQFRAPNVLVPGAENVPLNGVALVETNPSFVAAYLVGLNHETAREFAWRNLPTPLSDTWFDRFWDYIDEDRADIDPIADWPGRKGLAGSLKDAKPSTVILTRAELLRRYPDTIIYAVPALWDPDTKARVVTAAERDQAQAPAFDGRLGSGLRYVGFDLPPDEMIGGAAEGEVEKRPGWFIVFEEPLFAPRFGLDAYEGPRDGGAPTRVNDLHWGDFVVSEEEWATLTRLPKAPDWAGTPVEGHYWGANSSQIAAMTWQRPVRVMIHADRLVR